MGLLDALNIRGLLFLASLFIQGVDINIVLPKQVDKIGQLGGSDSIRLQLLVDSGYLLL